MSRRLFPQTIGRYGYGLTRIKHAGRENLVALQHRRTKLREEIHAAVVAHNSVNDALEDFELSSVLSRNRATATLD